MFSVIGYCTDPYFCIVTELCEGGSLDNVLRKAQSKLTLDQAVRVGREVAEGMKYLHALKPPIMHRDLSLGTPPHYTATTFFRS